MNALTSGSGRRNIEALRTSTHLLPHHLRLGLQVFFLLRILLLLLKGSEYVTESLPPLFRDPTAALDQRVDDLLSCLTLDERIAFLHQFAPAVDRLGLAAFRTGQEALHGAAWMGPGDGLPAGGRPRRNLERRPPPPGRRRRRPRDAGDARTRRPGGAQRVGADGQSSAASAVGQERGGLRRGPAPDGGDRHGVHPRPTRRRPGVLDDSPPSSSAGRPTTTRRTDRLRPPRYGRGSSTSTTCAPSAAPSRPAPWPG